MFKARLVDQEFRSLITANDLDPGELAQVKDEESPLYNNCIVMRSPETARFVLINLSNIGPDECWSGSCSLKVRKLNSNEVVILEVE